MHYHDPVLKDEVLEYLSVFEGGKYIDCTLGDGGHTVEILKKGGKVLGLDVDESSLKRAEERIKDLGLEKNFKKVTGNFKHIEKLAEQSGFKEVNGILYDLGYSSTQLDDNKGLSFLED